MPISTKTPRFDFAGKSWPLFTNTSAMSCWSWSIPAVVSCPGMVAKTEDDICFGCYAQNGRYNMKNVLDAQAARFAWLKALIKFDRLELFVDIVIRALSAMDSRYFRIHDSGDFFNPEYVLAWVQICKANPKTDFWAPTRSYHGKTADILDNLKILASLPNVVIRPSALHWNEPAPIVPGLSVGSTAILSADDNPPGHLVCPKSTSEQKQPSCQSVGCRACWEASSKPVSYLVHGHQGRHIVTRPSDAVRQKRTKTVASFVKLKVRKSDFQPV